MTPSDTRGSGPTRVLLIGDSAQLLALQAWAVSQGLGLAEAPEEDVACVIVDEDALDGMCTPAQAWQLAATRRRSTECLSPSAGWERLAALGRYQPDMGSAESVDPLTGVIDFPSTRDTDYGRQSHGP